MKTIPKATSTARTRLSGKASSRKARTRVRVALVHRRQEAERDSVAAARPRPAPSGSGPRKTRTNTASSPRSGQPVADVAERDRPEDRALVGDERAAGEQLLDEPPEVPGSQRQDREDVALVLGEVAQVVLDAAGGDERQPQQHDDRRADDRRLQRSPASPRSRGTTPRTGRGTAGPAASSSTRPRARRRPRASARARRGRRRRPRTGRRCYSYWPHQALTSMTAGWSTIAAAPSSAQLRPVARRHTTRSARRARGRPALAGSLHQRPDRRVRGGRHGLERRLERRQHAPDVGHDRREGQVLVVGVAERPSTAMPWTHRTNWSRSPRGPASAAARSGRGARGRARRRSPATQTRRAAGRDAGSLELDQHGLTRSCTGDHPSPSSAGNGPLVPPGAGRYAGPVDQYRSAEPPQPPSRAILRGLGADLSAISVGAVEQPLDLALVEGDAHDLALELVGDVGVTRATMRDVRREVVERRRAGRSSSRLKSFHQAYGKSS